MPKRSNPFGECSPLQMKTHVGKKEVDTGVNMEENMKVVYERTRSLLYQGSLKPVPQQTCDPSISMTTAGCHDDWDTMASTREELRPLPGQMRLDSDGQLVAAVTNGSAATSNGDDTRTEANPSSEVDMEEASSEATATNPQSMTPTKQLLIDASGRLISGISDLSTTNPRDSACKICHSCNRPVHIPTRRCNFCDKETCNSCVLQCARCQGLYCQVCCILNYDGCVEQPFCLQCSG